MNHLSTCGRACPGEPRCTITYMNAYGYPGQMGRVEAWAAFFNMTVEQWANAAPYRVLGDRGSKQGMWRGKFRQILTANTLSGEIDG